MTNRNPGSRKPLPDECNGGIFCPVPGHVESVPARGIRWTIRHIPLTQGQKRTLRERRDAAREARS